jgi:hypothetical protein
MLNISNRAVGTGRLFFIFAGLLMLGSLDLQAQRFFHVDVETKTVAKGKMRKTDKKIYYTKGGDLNILWETNGTSYYSTTSAFGFSQFYYPATNEVVSLAPDMMKASDELLFQFAEFGPDDLGLSREGFFPKSTKKDGDYIVRTFEPRSSEAVCARVEIAYNSDYLPIYCAYFDKKGKIITKTYLSNYKVEKGFAFPMRVTEISYLKEKNDSTVRLDLYRNLEIDHRTDGHIFRVPSDAKPVDLKSGLKSMVKGKK